MTTEATAEAAEKPAKKAKAPKLEGEALKKKAPAKTTKTEKSKE